MSYEIDQIRSTRELAQQLAPWSREGREIAKDTRQGIARANRIDIDAALKDRRNARKHVIEQREIDRRMDRTRQAMNAADTLIEEAKSLAHGDQGKLMEFLDFYGAWKVNESYHLRTD